MERKILNFRVSGPRTVRPGPTLMFIYNATASSTTDENIVQLTETCPLTLAPAVYGELEIL